MTESKYDCFVSCKRAMCDLWDDCLCASHKKCDIEVKCLTHNLILGDEEGDD